MKRFACAALALALFSVCLPAAAAAGKLRFYFDKNNNSAFDTGEAVPQNTVVYFNLAGGTSGSCSTAADGTITPIWTCKSGDKYYCKYLVYSHPANKGERGYAGSMFDLYLDSAAVSSTGDLTQRTLSYSEATTITNGGTVDVRLAHPVFCWNLVVALNWDASDDYLNKLKSGLEKSSDYLFDCTDGHMKLGRVLIKENVSQSSDLWKKHADIRIHSGGLIPHSYIGAVTSTKEGRQMYLSKYFKSDSTTSGDPDKSDYYRTTIHEAGHYLLDFFDEYLDGDGSQFWWDLYRFANHDECPDNYGLMDRQFSVSEMSSFNDYLSSYSGKESDEMTEEIWEYYRKSGGTFEPCWEHLYNRFDNSSGQCGLWGGGYGGVRAAISKPPAGRYQGTDFWGNEKRSVSDRNGPASITEWLGGVRIWYKCEFSVSAAGVGAVGAVDGEVELTVLGPDGCPASGARVWLEKSGGERVEQGRTGRSGVLACTGARQADALYASFDGRVGRTLVDGPKAEIRLAGEAKGAVSSNGGPRLVISARLSAPPQNDRMWLRVYTSETLAVPPEVWVRPDFGPRAAVAMAQVGARIYEGNLYLGGATAGAVDVLAVGAGGQAETSTEFILGSFPAGATAAISSPDGRLTAHIPGDLLTVETYTISIGGGGAVIAHPDPSMRLVQEPVTFRVHNGLTIGPNYSINWLMDKQSLAGLDSATTTLCRFSESTGEWITVASGFTPGFRFLSGVGKSEGIFAVFARESADNTPPGPVLDLAAVTGEAGQAVRLSFAAPGDDGMSGRAARYHVYFNTEPITPENIASCTELPLKASPQDAGTLESFSFEMPDPDTLYYFVVQAQDEAENLGPLSNVASAVSYVQDTDGDGLPDQWEEANGFDPQTPGEENQDPDDDGLANLQEYRSRTNPLHRDTDGDGLGDGLEVAASTSPLNAFDPPFVGSASLVKRAPDMQVAGCPYLVVTSAGACVYAQEADRSAGIGLDAQAAEGSAIEVIGRVGTGDDGERKLFNCVARERGSEAAAPLAITNRALGGGDWFWGPSAGQQGVEGGFGLNNIGLLVRVWGRVVEADTSSPPGWFRIDDGSGVGVKCAVPGGVEIDPDWQWVCVTGISSCEKNGAVLNRLLKVRKQSDIVPY